MRAFPLSGLVLCLVLTTTVAFSGEKADSSAKLVCPVSGKPIDKSVSSEFGGGKVCFCCDKCKAKFDANNAKFVAKANLQLAASGQAKQTACPFSGKALDASTTVNVAGVDVQFCCDKCKAKVAAAKTDKQIQMVFDSKAFCKAFKIAKDK
jgi:YHS domain-containing protein